MDKPANDAPFDRSLAEDEALLIKAVEAAGDLAMSYFGRGLTGNKKADDTPVSEADLAVDRLLCEQLVGARPDYGWLSEETADRPDRLKKRRVWIVDPIDGTRAFLAGLTDWTVSVALVEDGEPVLGAILNPAKSDLFAARRGKGAELNGRPISVTKKDQVENSRIIASKGYFKRKIWHSPWPPVSTFWVNSAAYRMALIAAGKADATVSLSGKSEWDLAAAVLLVQEAGGKVSDANGASLHFNKPQTRIYGLVAAAPRLHAQLVSRTQQVVANS